jgi:ABC-type dipeptide/oligopeptide/nickel transport system permease component
VGAYIRRRLIIAVFILFFLSIAVFLMLRVAPGDPALLRCGTLCEGERLEALRADLGLDEPYHMQYLRWMGNLLRGDLGESNFTQTPVIDAVKQRFPATLELLAITVLTTVAIGVPFGIISALYRNSLPDYSVRMLAILGLSVPSFWIATMVLLIPSEAWGYAPPLGSTVSFFDNPWDNLRQFVPPAIVLGAASAAGIMRLTRSSLLEVLRQDYIRTARSKGLRERTVIGRHALKNSLIPVTTVVGLQLIGLLGGAVIIEQVFNIRGLGQYLFTAIFTKDFQVVQTMTLYIGATVVLLNLVVDVMYAWLDPRIRYS